MAENNTELIDELPETPNPALKELDRLVGEWRMSGPSVQGVIRYEWMEGGFYFIQHVDIRQDGEHIKGVEYVGFDEETGTLRSHLFGTDGSHLTYTYSFDGDTMYYWFGDKGSDTYSESTFSPDGRTIAGRWHIPTPEDPNAGFEHTLTRLPKTARHVA